MNVPSEVSIISQIRFMFSVATALVLAGTASAAVIQGTVSCTDTVPPTPIPNVTVIAAGSASAPSSVTDSNGNYSISFTLAFPDLYQVHLSNLPAGLTYVDPPSGVTNVFIPIDASPPVPANFVLSGCASTNPPPTGEIGGWVWEDLSCNGVEDWEEPGLADVEVDLTDCDGLVLTNTWTDADGHYRFSGLTAGDYALQFIAPPAYEFSPTGHDSTADPVTGATVCFPLQAGETNLTWDAGLCRLEPPGARGQGYWKNHPGAWPVEQIEIGGVTYDKAEAILTMRLPTKGDKWLNMFEKLVAAKLNVLVGNESDCIEDTILSADAWMEAYPSPVRANSPAWKHVGSDLHSELNKYNNGHRCAVSAE